MMNWDTDKTKLLIQEYRKRRILWDLHDPNFTNYQKKAKLWKELALEFNCSTKEIKGKVRNLTTTFHSYRKKKIISNKNYYWVHYVSLSFLLNVNAPKKGISVEDTDFNEDINFENDDVENQQENQAAGSKICMAPLTTYEKILEYYKFGKRWRPELITQTNNAKFLKTPYSMTNFLHLGSIFGSYN